jgi:hypothetical protein
VLWDQSVSWMWKAYQTLNNPVIIKKVKVVVHQMPTQSSHPFARLFEMCHTGNFNLSYDSLTSFEARQELRDFKTVDPKFWDQLTCKATPDLNVMGNETITENDETTEPIFEDDSDLPCEVIITEVLGSKTRGVASTATGAMILTATAESLDENDMEVEKLFAEPEGDEMVGTDNPTELGRGKKKRITNQLYNLKSFWRHNDNEASDDE